MFIKNKQKIKKRHGRLENSPAVPAAIEENAFIIIEITDSMACRDDLVATQDHTDNVLIPLLEVDCTVPIIEDECSHADIESTRTADEDTTIGNIENRIFLEPLDLTTLPPGKKKGRKRKLARDFPTELSGWRMLSNQDDTSDIIKKKMILAPPTKTLMRLEQFHSMDVKARMPASSVGTKLKRLFMRNMRTKPVQDFDDPCVTTRNTQIVNSIDDEEEEMEKTSPKVSKILRLEELPPGDEAVDQPPDSMDQVVEDPTDIDADVDEDTSPPVTSSDVRVEQDLPEKSPNYSEELREAFSSSATVSFRTIACTKKDNRKQAAARFFNLLTLSKNQIVFTEQVEASGDIVITRGPTF